MVERENSRMASEALLLQSAAASVMGGEDGLTAFNEIIEGLREE